MYFLGLIASQRELFQVGRDLNAQTGNLSPLVAAGLFYLVLTIPLTHLVNYIDARLRTRQDPTEPEDPLAPLNPASSRRWSDDARAAAPVSLAGKDIHLSFGPNKVLRGVDIDVPAGTTAAVIGPSGSGKSTLLRTLNRLYEPDSGDILLDGRSVLTRRPGRSCGSGSAWCSSSSTCSRTAACWTTSRWRRASSSGCRADAARELGAGAVGPGRLAAQGRCPARRRCPAASSSGSRSPARWR